jgi:hypothetical protein
LREDAEDAREMYCWKCAMAVVVVEAVVEEVVKRFLDLLNLRRKWTSGGEWVVREQD